MEVVGIGLNEAELAANPILSSWAIHDLNTQPDFSIASTYQKGNAGGQGGGGEGRPFEAVICNVSIDYLTNPLEVMRSIGEVLTSGGMAYMAVSNRCFPTKVSIPRFLFPLFPANPFLRRHSIASISLCFVFLRR